MKLKLIQIYELIYFLVVIFWHNKTAVYNHLMACKNVNYDIYEVKKLICECDMS